MELDKKTSDELWGEDTPYSQVQIVRETRILGDKVTRTLYYVYASINPTTYKTLKRNEKKIKEPFIHNFLNNAEYISKEEGYRWYIYSKETNNPRQANKVAKELTELVISMHQKVSNILGLEPEKKVDAMPGYV